MSSPYPVPNVTRLPVRQALPKPSAHLSRPAKRWWREVVERYTLEPHHLRLLTEAATAWDRAQQARRLLDDEGLVVQDRFGQKKAHPAASIERDSRTLFARLLRELDLDGSPLPTPRQRGG